MMYQAYQSYVDMAAPLQAVASAVTASSAAWPGLLSPNSRTREFDAFHEWLALARLTHQRPPFGIRSVQIDRQVVTVSEEVVNRTPFCSLLHFRKDVQPTLPRVLLVAPLAGHFATLLRGTVATMLAEHDVYVTDWHNARDVPLADGPFGFDDFVGHLVRFLELLGPGTHVVAVCQPTVATLAAVALMAEDDSPAQPRSMTLIAGPNDTRVNPTQVDEWTVRTPLAWFENNLIDLVPMRFPGAMRRVYPGFVQLGAFMSLDLRRHVSALIDFYNYRVQGDTGKAEVIRAFYANYFATMDLPAEFYLDTVSRVFQQHALPLGKLLIAGRRVDTRAIKHTALLTIEGEKDDICAVGQTEAAHEMCGSLPPYMKTHYMQTGVGHYGVFAGRRWEAQIYPIVRELIHDSEIRRASVHAPEGSETVC
ncbi:polyhydroxyalkanoate depolymerase [Paraburkholderia sp. IMGN_8]|uniref:polyhydroxyalkanoate depolymerase n=1 Tax=Paraburkholderia sp. IMGN_8 TaxID=3136564 RepID=UPI003101B31A